LTEIGACGPSPSKDGDFTEGISTRALVFNRKKFNSSRSIAVILVGVASRKYADHFRNARAPRAIPFFPLRIGCTPA
jgi:hypothetical protein